jgi:acetate CoA/acetoacetate CoA-transferase alpha subunit
MKQAIKAAAAAALVPDGAVVMIGGFMGVGTPHRLIDALVEADRRNLTIIANDTAKPGFGIGKLISAGAVSRVVTSHIGLNPDTQKGMIDGKIKVDLVPQGTLIERIRAAGFGLGGVLTKTGLGTLAAEGQRTIEIDGEEWLLALPLKAGFALIHADQADHMGNLTYQLTATNFNPILAMAADIVICESREILPVGMLPPDAIKTPGILVDYLIERPRP